MKILIVAGFFPPYSPASASRVNKLSKHLENHGHDIRVLCPKNDAFKPVLEPEINLSLVHYTEYFRINDLPNNIVRRLKALVPSRNIPKDKALHKVAGAVIKTAAKSPKRESLLSRIYRAITNIPDNMIGWYPQAIRTGLEIVKDQKPDVIFATAPPFTTLVVAARLGRKTNVPIVYDFRDLWTQHPYSETKGFRGKIMSRLDAYLLKQAAGLVTVTHTWAKFLSKNCRTPVEFVMNGFDPADFSNFGGQTLDPEKLTLIYAGHLYGSKRDPSVLFEAIGKLVQPARQIRVLFYTPFGERDLTDNHRLLIAKYDLKDIVECNTYIPQRDLLDLQQRADILLLLRWDDPREDGVIAGKLFEYIGAGRPILALGSETGEAADIIRENNFGTVSNDANKIADFLNEAVHEKLKDGAIKFETANREKFTRAYQFSILEIFLEDVVANYKK